MLRSTVLAATLSATALTGCQSLSNQDEANLGLLVGATAGVLTANALDASPEWTILAGLAGAAAGTLVARNSQDQNCAYARGDGTYYVAACP